MRNLLIRWLVLAAAIAVAAAVVDGIEIEGGVLGLLAVAALFGLVNALVRPIVRLLALPLRVMTLGLVSFVINGLMLVITDWLLDVLDVGGLGPAIVAAIVISIVAALLNWLLIDRRAGRARTAGGDVHGLADVRKDATMTGFAKELIDESLGASSKRWALMVFALGVGALGALWFVGRNSDRSSGIGSAPPAPAPTRADDMSTLVGGAATQVGSAWRKVSTPPAVMRKALTSNPIAKRRAGATPTE